MQTQLAVLALYPDLVPEPFGSDFKVVSNEIVEWNTDKYPEPTEEDLETAWLSAVKKAKVAEFESLARDASSAVMLDALVELANAPRTGALPSMPNVSALKDIQGKLSRARNATQGVTPQQHGGDPVKAAKGVEDLKWEDL